MLILVEGPRNVGKTFLLNSANAPTYKFPFADIDSFTEKGEPFSGGLTIGKDLQLLHLYAAGHLSDGPIFVDRSIVSTIAYGCIFGRFSNNYAMKIIGYLKINKLLENVKLIHIIGENPRPRPLKDEDKFEELTYETQWGTFKNTVMLLLANCGMKCNTFVNRFDPSSVKQFAALIEEIKRG